MIRLLKANAKLILLLGLLCASYLVFQCLYIPYSAYTGDELWFAHHIYQYTHALPYRDFLPYKTILGYYLLTPPFWGPHDPAAPLYYARVELALINTVMLFVISLWSSRFFKLNAIILTLVLILCNQLFLLYSVDLRVDLLTSWMGLVSVLLILSQRPVWAGFALGISFLISQKAIWFWVATDMALITQCLFLRHHLQPIRSMMMINIIALIVLFAYLVFAAALSNWHTVLNSVFYEAFTQAKITWYSRIWYPCWQTILSNGPLLFFLWPMALLGLCIRDNPTVHARRVFIFIYSSCIIGQLFLYQQPFPYQMVYLVPAYFLLFSDFFSWLPGLTRSNPSQLSRKKVFWLTVFFTLFAVCINIVFALPVEYFFLIALAPCLYAVIFQFKKEFFLILSLSLVLTGGILYPLMRFYFIAQEIDGRYQKSMVLLSQEILSTGGQFFAGSPLLYNQDQAIDGLKNLIGPAIEYLYHPTPKLLPVMIPSLYLEPRTATDVLKDLAHHPAKFFVNNYRIASLPHNMKNFLYANYSHYWGSIYSYAPTIVPGKHQIHLEFSGIYQLINSSPADVWLDHNQMKAGKMAKLSKGFHLSISKNTYRLKLILPASSTHLSSDTAQDKWYAVIRAIII